MKATSHIEWIFFDVGQTLLDETAAWREQCDRLCLRLAKLGRQVTLDEVMSYYEQCCADFAPRQWKAIVEQFAPSPESVQELMKIGDGWRHDLEVPFRDAEPTLRDLATHYRLGIIANQSLGTRERMAKHGLLRHLSLVIGSAEAGVIKPDPAIFRLALAEANCPAEHSVMVGDRIDNDIRPANLLGMRSVHVRQGGSGAQRPREPAEVPTASIDHLRELTPALVASL